MTGIRGSGRGQLLVLLLAAALTSAVRAEDVWHLIDKADEDEMFDDALPDVQCSQAQFRTASGACKPCAHASTSGQSNGLVCGCAAGYSHFDAISGECLQRPTASLSSALSSSSSDADDSDLVELRDAVASAQRALLAPSYPPTYGGSNTTNTTTDNVATQALLSNSSSPLVKNGLITNATDPRVVGKAEVQVTVSLTLKAEDVAALEGVADAQAAKQLINKLEAAYKGTLAAQGVRVSALNVSSTITVDPPANCDTIKTNIKTKVIATWPASSPVPYTAIDIIMNAVQCSALASGGGRRLLLALGGARTLNACGATSPQLDWSIGLAADQAAGVGAAKTAVNSVYSSGTLSSDLGTTVCGTTTPTVKVTTVVTVAVPLTEAGLATGANVCGQVAGAAAAAIVSALGTGASTVTGGTSCSTVRTVAQAGPVEPIPTPDEKHKLTGGEIAAVVICSILGAALIAAAVIIVIRRRNSRVAATPASGSTPHTPSAGACQVVPEPAGDGRV